MKLIDYTNPNSLSSRMRRKRMRYFIELVSSVIQKEASTTITILDIGGTETYWKNFPFSQFENVSFRIALINLNYPDYDSEIATLAENVSLEKLIGNACHLDDFKDNSWDIVHSNSVIEHVGGWEQIKAMASEIYRVGRYYFVQTPNYWFLIEPHFVLPFIQFFPRPIRVWILMRKKACSMEEAILDDEGKRLLTKKEMKILFPNGQMLTERFLGLPKSIMVRSFLRE